MRKALLLGIAFWQCCTVAQAELRVLGQGNTLRVDTSGFPPRMRSAYALMSQKCTRCHSLERIIVAVQSGEDPVTKVEFSRKTVRDIVVRMYLKPDSDITKSDARTVVSLLRFLIDVQQTGLPGRAPSR